MFVVSKCHCQYNELTGLKCQQGCACKGAASPVQLNTAGGEVRQKRCRWSAAPSLHGWLAADIGQASIGFPSSQIHSQFHIFFKFITANLSRHMETEKLAYRRRLEHLLGLSTDSINLQQPPSVSFQQLLSGQIQFTEYFPTSGIGKASPALSNGSILQIVYLRLCDTKQWTSTSLIHH